MNDLTGKRFGRLVVLERAENRNSRTMWLCRCDCDGKTKIINGYSLTNGKTQSCGCIQKEKQFQSHKKYNTYDLSDEYGIGYTSKGEEFYFDLEDYDKIKNHCWYISISDGYVISKIYGKLVCLHRFILNYYNKDKFIDHINRKKYDNRKTNLRYCTNQENTFNQSLSSNNTSGYKGVHYSKRDLKWVASIKVNYKNIFLGYFDNKEDAYKVRLLAEERYFGEFASEI